jgi:tRNA(adenine34) deaminase
MSGVRQVHYGARDREAGSIVLLTGTPYIANKHIQVSGPYPEVQTISLVLMTDHLLRLNSPRTPDFIRSFQQDDPRSVGLGKEWFSTGYLTNAANERWSINRVIEAIESALGNYPISLSPTPLPRCPASESH